MQVNTGSGWPLEMVSFNVEVRSYENDNKNMKKYLGTDHLTCRGEVWFFVSFRIFFSDNTRVRIYFFCQVKWPVPYIQKMYVLL